jgi:hypothetical protein
MTIPLIKIDDRYCIVVIVIHGGHDRSKYAQHEGKTLLAQTPVNKKELPLMRSNRDVVGCCFNW